VLLEDRFDIFELFLRLRQISTIAMKYAFFYVHISCDILLPESIFDKYLAGGTMNSIDMIGRFFHDIDYRENSKNW